VSFSAALEIRFGVPEAIGTPSRRGVSAIAAKTGLGYPDVMLLCAGSFVTLQRRTAGRRGRAGDFLIDRSKVAGGDDVIPSIGGIGRDSIRSWPVQSPRRCRMRMGVHSRP